MKPSSDQPNQGDLTRDTSRIH
jgi:hypothetical protein